MCVCVCVLWCGEGPHLQGIQHPFPGHNDLLGLLLDRQRANQSSHFLCRLPLGQLPQSLLPRPHTGVNDLQKQLARARVEDEDSTIDWLGGQVTLKRL